MAALTEDQILQVVAYLAENGVKITELSAADAATGTELFEVVQSGVSKKMTAAQVVALVDSPTYALETITPVITIGAGSAFDFDCVFRKEGNFVSFDGICRGVTVAGTETSTVLTLELPASFAPAADFTTSAQFFGGVYPNVYESAIGKIESINAISNSGSKKIVISITLVADASGDFPIPLTIRGTYQIVV